MCGIFGAISADCVNKTMQALRFLEYRGYDSAGVCVKNSKLQVVKSKGRVDELMRKLPSNIGGQSAIGHTRWATHGAVCDENAHPFLSMDGNFAICHNGILENHLQLKKTLTEFGFRFVSQTDSEAVAHLLQYNYKGNVLDSVLKTANSLQGSFAILAQTTHNGNIYAIKNRSPLVVGVSKQEVFLCSDVRCLYGLADKVAVVPDGTVVEASSLGVRFWNFNGKSLSAEFFQPQQSCREEIDETDNMLREIGQIPQCLRNAKQGYFQSGGIGISSKQLTKFRRVYFLGCGTAYNSGLETCAVARNFCNADISAVVASEFIYDNYPVDDKTLAFCISQSGETADTIRAAEKVVARGGFAYAVTNTDVSSLCFVCNKVKNVCAGGEFAVASTKAYNCQVLTLLLLMLDFSQARGEISQEKCNTLHAEMDLLPVAVDSILRQSYEISQLAEEIKNSSSVFFVGRTMDFPTATEGSLKLKEISYIHSEAYPSGELKHGTLALMEEGVTVVAISTVGQLVEKNNSTVNEVSARKARVLTVSPFGGGGMHITLPVVHSWLYGIISVVPLQLLAYFVAKRLGRDVDKPRNLAKSVTVE